MFDKTKKEKQEKSEEKQTPCIFDKNEEIIQQLTLDMKMKNEIGLEYFN